MLCRVAETFGFLVRRRREEEEEEEEEKKEEEEEEEKEEEEAEKEECEEGFCMYMLYGCIGTIPT